MKSLHWLSCMLAVASLLLSGPVLAGTVNVIANPPNSGWTTGSGNYPSGVTITMTANASNSWRFAQWENSQTNPVRQVVTKGGKRLYTATFTNIIYGTIGLISEPLNGGSVYGSGSYPVGQSVAVNAIAAPGWTFNHWQDLDTAPSRTITVPSGSVLMTATFSNDQIPKVMANLSWPQVPNPAEIKKYVVYWGVSHNNYTGAVSSVTTSVSIDNLISNIPYFFMVKSVATTDLSSFPSCEVVWQYPGTNSCP